MKAQHKLLIALGLITGTAIWALAGSSGAAPFLDVHQVVEASERHAEDEISVKGIVVANTTSTENQLVRFTLRDASGDPLRETTTIEVVYQGVLPDAFGPKMVVVTGTLAGTEAALILHASEIQVGCSSKY